MKSTRSFDDGRIFRTRGRSGAKESGSSPGEGSLPLRKDRRALGLDTGSAVLGDQLAVLGHDDEHGNPGHFEPLLEGPGDADKDNLKIELAG